jgi:hypothetical protein
MTGTHALGNWHTNPPKGYPRFHSGAHRDRYVHMVVFEQLAQRPVTPGLTIHHQNFNKRCFCPHNLLECPPEFHTGATTRDPYTGQYLNRREYEQRYAA